MENYHRDPYKAGAADVLDKPFDDVTRDERHNFKHAFFKALHSRLVGKDGEEFLASLTDGTDTTMKNGAAPGVVTVTPVRQGE